MRSHSNIKFSRRMNKLISLAFTLTTLGLWVLNVQAQRSRPASPGDPRGFACASCVVVLIIPFAILVLNIALLVWVARDAKARGMDSSALWMILVMFTSVIGLLIYILSRPQGHLIRCLSCGNNRLQVSAICPQCGNA
jgi:uncharacterized membrane protein YhaH (DUF805 family)